MQTIVLSGIQVPIPPGWQLADNGRSYVGDAGLVDPRQTDDKSPVDEQRAQIAKNHLSQHSPEVQLLEVQGRSCLVCKFLKGDAMMATYSLHGNTGRTVEIVYVFRPGYDEILRLVHQEMLSAGPISGEQINGEGRS